MTPCPKCQAGSTWCLYVCADTGRHDRYCDTCKYQWQTFHLAPDLDVDPYALLELCLRSRMNMRTQLLNLTALLNSSTPGRHPEYDLACRDIAHLLHTIATEDSK